MSPGWMDSGVDLLEGFVDEDGISCGRRCGCCEDEEPTGGDDGSPKGIVAGIYEMNTQESTFLVQSNGGSTECMGVERISTKLRQGPECRPGKFLPGYVVYDTEPRLRLPEGRSKKQIAPLAALRSR